jgi:hypothetical protein
LATITARATVKCPAKEPIFEFYNFVRNNASICVYLRKPVKPFFSNNNNLRNYILTLNQRVQGSSPCAPTNEIKDLGRNWYYPRNTLVPL